jgi:hypothetical protein
MLLHSSNSFIYANHDIAANEEAIVQPRPADVLLGRGTKHQRHPGNIRYTGTNIKLHRCARPRQLRQSVSHHILSVLEPYIDLIRSHRDAYFDSEDTLEKKLIVCRIVDVIFERGGRFLKRVHANTWIVVPKDVARTKAAHAIQYRQRKSLQCLSSSQQAPAAAVGMDTTPLPPESSRAAFSNHHDTDSMAVDPLSGSEIDPNYGADIPMWISTFADSSLWEPIEFKATAAAHQETYESISNVGTTHFPSTVHQVTTAHALDVCSEIGPQLEPSPQSRAATDPFPIIAPCACKQVHALTRGANSPSPHRLVRTTSIGSFDAQEIYDKSHGDIKW